MDYEVAYLGLNKMIWFLLCYQNHISLGWLELKQDLSATSVDIADTVKLNVHISVWFLSLTNYTNPWPPVFFRDLEVFFGLYVILTWIRLLANWLYVNGIFAETVNFNYIAEWPRSLHIVSIWLKHLMFVSYCFADIIL